MISPKKYRRIQREANRVRCYVTRDLLKAMMSYSLWDRLTICYNILMRRY